MPAEYCLPGIVQFRSLQIGRMDDLMTATS
jgi:hypothetical protein